MDNKEIQGTRAEMASGRSNIYGLLSVLYKKEPTTALVRQIRTPQFLDVLSGAGINLDKEFLEGPEEKIIEDLAVEYARLFLGPGRHISPHESVHHERDDGDWGTLWGKSTVEVKNIIESSGLEYKSDYHGMPDHISIEMEFMREAAKREAQAWKEKDKDGAMYCLKLQKLFMEEHLIKWLPLFCDKVVSDAGSSFYGEMAKLTKSFISLDRENINQCISEADNNQAS